MSAESEETVAESPDEAQIEDEVTSPEETGSEEVEVSGDPAAEDTAAVEEEVSPDPDEPTRSEEAQEEAGGKPFSFRVSGRDVAVEGAGLYEHDDGSGGTSQSVVIPADSWQRNIQPYLQDGGAIAREKNELQQQIESLDPKNNETVVRAQSLLDNFEEIISSPEKLTEFLENFDQNKEVLRLKADLASRTAGDELRASREEAQSSEERDAEIYQQIDADISDSAGAVFNALNLDIGDEHKQQIGEFIYDRRANYYRHATDEDARLYGVTAGEVVFDTDLAAADMQRLASFAPTPKANTATQKARKANEAILNPKDPPKTVPADGSPAPSKDKTGNFKTREEYEKWEDS